MYLSARAYDRVQLSRSSSEQGDEFVPPYQGGTTGGSVAFFKDLPRPLLGKEGRKKSNGVYSNGTRAGLARHTD